MLRSRALEILKDTHGSIGESSFGARSRQAVVVESIEVADPRRRGDGAHRRLRVCHSDLSATNAPFNIRCRWCWVTKAPGWCRRRDGVDNFAVGDHVVSSFVSMCGHCIYCQTGRPQLCVQSLKSLFTLPDGTVRTRDSAGKDLNVFADAASWPNLQPCTWAT